MKFVKGDRTITASNSVQADCFKAKGWTEYVEPVKETKKTTKKEESAETKGA